MDFDIKISCHYGIVSWQISFDDQLGNEHDDDCSYILNVARELKDFMLKLQKFNTDEE